MTTLQAKSLVTHEFNGEFKQQIEFINIRSLSEGEILIKTQYSSLNYKDALSASGHKGITRNYPHIPGIDVAGVVTKSNSPLWHEGDEVICTGFDLGMNISGGFSEYVIVPGNWCLNKPENISLKQAMIFGTAGLTAALSILAILQYEQDQDNKNALVTGASGGVGLISALILKELGFNVTVTTRSPEHSFLGEYGFNQIIQTSDIISQAIKPLMQRQYNAAIDTLGGNVLSRILTIIDYHGVIASCGNITGNEYQTTVLPMIIRGVKLFGITSANALMHSRKEAWQLLNKHNHIINDKIYREIALEELPIYIERMILGKHNKRTIIKF
ncbi:MAG: YhdH/YhfP family quinone oxidoreductase [Rickettsiales bacterium]|jgi:acrylyl-CoA reductase (NADPH)|nr:YhdH/YhfP family quinone oxidoreductase [Rickettsiales bacterium]